MESKILSVGRLLTKKELGYKCNRLALNGNFFRPLANSKLRVTHISQLPALRAQNRRGIVILHITSSTSHEQRRHEMVISSVSISEARMLHQTSHSPTQLHTGRLGNHILKSLSELQGPILGRSLHGKVIAESQHGSPPVTVEVVHGTARANEEVVLLPQGAQGRTHLHMEVRIVAGIGGDQSGGRAATGKHADEDEVDVVNPFEIGVTANVEAFLGEHLDTPVGSLEIGVQLVVDVLFGSDVGHGTLAGFRVRGEFDSIAQAIPVRALIVDVREKKRREKWYPFDDQKIPTIMTTPLMFRARASSPHFFQ